MKKKKPAKTKAKRTVKKPTKKKAGMECYHCRQWLTEKERESHDCWTTTETALTQDLPEDLKDAWQKIREIATQFGPQRIYASHKSIMFSRKYCYFFVRPTPKRLELVFFTGKIFKHDLIKKANAGKSKTKVDHLVHIIHADQIESPLTDWLQEAYDFCPV